MEEFQLIGVRGGQKKSGFRNALGQETSDVSFHATKEWLNHQEKYACKALLVRNCGLHPLIHTLLESNLTQDVEFRQRKKTTLTDPMADE